MSNSLEFEMMSLFRVLVLLIFTLGAVLAVSAQDAGAGSSQQQPKKLNERPAASTRAVKEPFDDASVEKMASQCVLLDTEAGAIEFEMLPEAAPESVRNFLNLVSIGAFDTTTFNRVVKDFVIQGGNFSTRALITQELAVRMARKVPDEPSYVKHVRGIVSLARPAEPNSASSHFFILVGDAPHLDGKFAAFGRVVRGMDVADAINRAPADGEKPDKPVHIKRAVVTNCTKVESKEK